MTSTPPTSTRPVVGRSSPAITRIKEVLPAWVGPSSMFNEPDASDRSMSARCNSPPTRRLMRSSASCMAHLRNPLCGCSQPLGETLHGRRADVQTKFGAAPQDVLGRLRPLVARQVVDFGLIEAAAEILTQVGRRLRIAQ